MTALEVIMEILMPFVTAIIIDQGLEAANLPVVYRYGILIVAMAVLSLIFGALAGKMPPAHRRVWRQICGKRSTPIFKLFLFPTLINSAYPVW